MNTRRNDREQRPLDRNCLNCGKELVGGRKDKRFCNDYCRSSHNNAVKAPIRPLQNKITGTIIRNRRILRKQLGDKKTIRVLISDMKKSGYNFNYLTHVIKHGKEFDFFCYEFRYRVVENCCEITIDDRFFENDC